MLVYTSITRSYLPKARVLAISIKKHHPDWLFVVLLSDVLPDNWDKALWPFDDVLLPSQFWGPDWRSWAFGHTVVELCTAIKGRGAIELINIFKPDKIMYLDPDICVYASLESLEDQLDHHDVLLTPHLLHPETTQRGIIEAEICTLQHGVYNLGFYAAKTTGQGLAFIEWWADRLTSYCISDIPGGLFTDQRWCDLAPCYFDNLYIVRDLGCNVATWNIAHRQISWSQERGWMAGGVPLRFYHFTGYDSGDGKFMLNRNAPDQPDAFLLWEEYSSSLLDSGQGSPVFNKWEYQCFSNQETIYPEMRQTYRNSPFLQKAFKDPFTVTESDCFFLWWQEKINRNPIRCFIAAIESKVFLRLRNSCKIY